MLQSYRMTYHTDCPVCASESLRELRTHTFDRRGRGGEATARLLAYYFELFAEPGADEVRVQIANCLNCGLIFTNPRLSEADLGRKYAAVAESDKARRRGRPHHLADRRRRVSELVQARLATAGKPTGADIMDYGGAEGYLLSPLIDRGHRGYVVDYIDYAREDDRIQYLGPADRAGAGPARFDFIFLFHVLEHVSDIVGLLRRLGGMLRPGGTLYVEVPLGAWLEWNELREPLTHINFFSEQSLAEAVRRAGLTAGAVSTDWQYTTHVNRAPCINLLARPAGAAEEKARPRSTAEQLRPLSELLPALRANPAYYGKAMLRGLIQTP